MSGYIGAAIVEGFKLDGRLSIIFYLLSYVVVTVSQAYGGTSIRVRHSKE